MERRARNACGSYWKAKCAHRTECNAAALHSIAGRYFIEDAIGISNETVTYLAEDRSEYNRVVVQVPVPKASPGAREWLVLEAQQLCDLGASGLVPSFIDAGNLHTLRTVFTVQSFTPRTDCPLRSHAWTCLRQYASRLPLPSENLLAIARLLYSRWHHCLSSPGNWEDVLHRDHFYRMAHRVRKASVNTAGVVSPALFHERDFERMG